MRSTIDIDESLIEEAMKLTKAKTKRELIDLSLRELINVKRRSRLADRIGKWDLDLTLDELKTLRSES